MRSLSIIIPAFNEERRLPLTLDTILQHVKTLRLLFAEILVVDDGSSDGTAEIVREYSRRDPRIRLVSNPGNRGKGYAVRNGFSSAQGDWMLFTDADLSAPIEEFDHLVRAVEDNNAAGAIGSRAVDRSLVGVHQSWFRESSGKFFNTVMRIITGLPFRDTQCGFKLFRADAAQLAASLQRIDGFGFDVEMLYILQKHRFPIVEVPVRWNNAEGTKVSLWSGLAAFADPVRVVWNDWRGRYERKNVRL